MAAAHRGKLWATLGLGSLAALAAAVALLLIVPPRVWPHMDCAYFDTRDEAQAVFKNPIPPIPFPFDYHHLDADGNGVACDGLPSSFRRAADAAKQHATAMQQQADRSWERSQNAFDFYRNTMNSWIEADARNERSPSPENARSVAVWKVVGEKSSSDLTRANADRDRAREDAAKARATAGDLERQVERQEAEAGLLPLGQARLILAKAPKP